MKIALFTDTLRPQINGLTNTIEQITDYFDKNGIEYKIYAPKYGGEDNDLVTERFYSFKFFLYPECRLALPNFFQISSSLTEFQPDIIHIMTEFSMGLAGLHFGKKFKIPTISNYTTNFSQYAEYYKFDFLKEPIWNYMRWFHNQNHITLCPSRETEILLNEHDIDNTSIFSRGIDSKRFNPSYRNDVLRKTLGIDDKIAFLYVGRISQEKDIGVLANSYKQIKNKYPKAAMVITGEGPYLDECKDLFPEDTIFTGFLKGKQLSEIYASCDVFVCPSCTETFGNVVLEAMASGLAVIGADAGGIKETLKHGDNGLKFEAKNTDHLFKCMESYIIDEGLKSTITNQGLLFAKNRTWDSIIDGLYNIYCDIINSNNYHNLIA